MGKKIIFLTHSANEIGGAEDDFERILSYFSNLPDYDIQVLCPKGKRLESYSAYAEKTGVYKEGWLPVIQGSFFSYIKYIFIGIKQIWDIRKFMKETKYTYAVINVSVLFFPLLYIYLSKIKSIVFIRETITPISLRSFYYKLIGKLSNYFIGVSDFNSIDFKKLSCNDNSSVLYSSIESEKARSVADDIEFEICLGHQLFDELNTTNSFKLLLNGNICKRKNQLLGLRMMSQLVNVSGSIDIKLFFVGDILTDKAYYDSVIEYINNHNLKNHCFIIGPISKQFIYKLYEKIDLSIITSLSEGLPLSMVESFSFKKPVISTNVGGISEVVQNGVNGFIIDSFDEIEIAKRVEELRRNHLLYKSLSENCYDYYLNTFNLDVNMKKLEAILINL